MILFEFLILVGSRSDRPNAFPKQKKLIKFFQTKNKGIINGSRQCGKSLLQCGYALWFALFHDDKLIGTIGPKLNFSEHHLGLIKELYQNLPLFLQIGLTHNTKNYISFKNGSTILLISASSGGRGIMFDLLFFNEAAFINNKDLVETLKCHLPYMNDANRKVFLISTPNKKEGEFWTIWNESQEKINSWDSFKLKHSDVGLNLDWRQTAKLQLMCFYYLLCYIHLLCF